MEDETQAENTPLLRSDERREIALDRDRVVGGGQPESAREPANVGIDGQPRLLEGDGQHDVRRLAPDTRQGDELVAATRNLAGVARDERRRHADEIAGLGVEKARRPDDPLELADGGSGEICRRREGGEQRRGDEIDPLVGRLCREDRRHEELEGSVVPQFTEITRPARVLHGEARRHDPRTPRGAPRFGHCADGSETGRSQIARPTDRYRERMDRVAISRRVGDETVPAIAALLAARSEALGYRPLDEDSWHDLAVGRQPGFAGFIARRADAPGIVGYAQLRRKPAAWELEYVLDPATAGVFRIGGALCRAALDAVAEEGGGRVQLWTRSPTATSDEIAGSLGLVAERELYQMRRPLPVDEDSSSPIATRPFRVGADEPAWLELNNSAFAAHPEQGSWSADMLAERELEAWFDPTGFLVHERAGKMAAFCWTKVHDSDPPLGEIYVLGVDPTLQARGIGASMLAAGLDVLSGKGLRTAMLYVDADNERAVELYRAFGFVVDHRDRAYGGDIAPAR